MAITIEPGTPRSFVERLDAATTKWQQRFAEVARFAPPRAPIDDVLAALLTHHGLNPSRGLRVTQLLELDRVLAERTLKVLLQFELAYDEPRLDADAAAGAAAELFARFGPTTRWFATIDITPELLDAKEGHHPRSFCVLGWLFGSTLEEGLIAYDPEGLIGAVFVGDED